MQGRSSHFRINAGDRPSRDPRRFTRPRVGEFNPKADKPAEWTDGAAAADPVVAADTPDQGSAASHAVQYQIPTRTVSTAL